MNIQVVFVCTGNTCRSPMAAALFATVAKEEPELRNVQVSVLSAGLHAAHGSPAADGSIRSLREVGIMLDDHASRPFDEALAASDLILTMTESHKGEIILKFPHAAANVYTLKEYAREAGSPDISDPFGSDDDVYRATLREIRAAVIKAVKRLARDIAQR